VKGQATTSSRFRHGDLDPFPLYGGDALLFENGKGEAHRLTADDLVLLRCCRRFLSLREHAVEQLNATDFQALRDLAALGPKVLSRWTERLLARAGRTDDELAEPLAKLRGWAELGLLTAQDDFLTAMSGQAKADVAPPPIGVLGITTRQRPEELQRCLDSYAMSLTDSERSLEIVLIDDALGASDAEPTRVVAEQFARSSGWSVRYAGRADRSAWAERLAREAGVDPAVTQFGLLGDERCTLTTGSARNALQLDAAGEMYVMADDDGLCRAAPWPERTEGLALSSEQDPTRFCFYATRDEAFRKARPANVDVIAIHERLLGRSIGGLVDASPADQLELDPARPALLTGLSARGGAVRTTMAGELGDSGIGATAYLHINAESLPRLLRSERFYRAAVESGEVLRAAPRDCVGEFPRLMGTHAGFDNRSLLPPFPPVQRNSDGVFARLLRRSVSDGYVGFLSDAVVHHPSRGKRRSMEDWFRAVARQRFSTFLINLMAAGPEALDNSDPAREMSRLGRWLREAASGDPRQVEEIVRRRVAAFEASRAAAPSPDEASWPNYYRAMHRRERDVLKEALASPNYAVLQDFDHIGSSDEVRRFTQSLIRRTGELLEAWPALWEAALGLRRRGDRLTRRVEV